MSSRAEAPFLDCVIAATDAAIFPNDFVFAGGAISDLSSYSINYEYEIIISLFTRICCKWTTVDNNPADFLG
jgi:hypothetical protein